MVHYVEGPLNVIANTFSRLSRTDNDVSSSLVGNEAAANISGSKCNTKHFSLIEEKATANVSNSKCDAKYSPLIDDRDVLECFLALPCHLLNNMETPRHTK